MLDAGFSADLGMPLVKKLSSLFFREFNYANVKNLIEKIKDKKPYGENIKLSSVAFEDILKTFAENDNLNNYEAFIAKIENLNNITPNNEYNHTINFFKSILYDKIYDYFVRFHISTYPVYSIMKKTYSDFKNIISETEATWILSLNHDLIIEFLCLDYNIPLN